MRVQRKSNSQFLTLADDLLLGAGGEARIYAVPEDPSWVAKIWHKPTDERARKVTVMLDNPPADPMAAQRHISIAWPCDLLLATGRTQRVIGFLMPRISGLRPVIDFFNPKTRRQQCPLFNYFYLHRTARNLAIAVRALHERGYVIGDLNESNILASETALVTMVDTDSFQVWDVEQGVAYRCRVGKPEFTPPELQGKTFAKIDRAPQHDLFGLGAIIFQLLMEGTHPFAGAFKGKGEPPPYEQRIAAGHFLHGSDPRVPYAPKPAAPPFAMLHPNLQHLFIRCFEDGHLNPRLRPDTQSWQWALEEAESALVTCWANEQHIYGGHLLDCPWCARAKWLGGRDPFPSVAAVKSGQHLRPLASAARSRPAARSDSDFGPPIPRPIPHSTPSQTAAGGSGGRPSSRRKRPFAFAQARNDWAWLGLASGLLALFSGAFIPWRFNWPGFVLGVVAALLGAIGNIQARGWSLDGRSRWIARLAIVLGLLIVGIYLRNAV